ncbi:MAG: amidohydrolase family protein [Thermoanaerobaculales bacterium]
MRANAPVTLLHNAVVVTGGDASEVLQGGAVAWAGERITAVGPEADLRESHPDAVLLDARGGLALPGLINLHHHLYSAFARGLAPAEPPRDFGQVLDGLWWRLDRALTLETVRLSALLGAADCIRWGCTTIFDHHASPSCVLGSLDTIASALAEAGLSAALCYEISDRNGHHQALAGLEENLGFIANHLDNPRIKGMLGLHASFTVSDETLGAVAESRPETSGCHVHLAEDRLDLQVSKLAFGAAPLDRLEHSGLLDERALLVHGIHLTAADRATVANAGAVIVHCPESNANNGVGRLDVERAAGEGCTVALGTDGMSSAMLRSLRAAVFAQRGGRKDPAAGFSVHPGLLSTNATVARRFFEEPLLGELVSGAPADLCVIDSPPPTPISSENIFGHLVYGAAEAPVRHTVARGRVLLEDFRHTTLDPLKIAQAASKVAPELWKRFHGVDAAPFDWPAG